MDYEIKDSGERVEYDTGAKRDVSRGKGRFDLISPLVLERLAKHFEGGCKKYGPRNWEQGIPLGRYVDSALRHLFQWIQGERDEDHLAAVLWNIHGLMWTHEQIRDGVLPRSLDDNDYLTLEEGGGTDETPDDEAVQAATPVTETLGVLEVRQAGDARRVVYSGPLPELTEREQDIRRAMLPDVVAPQEYPHRPWVLGEMYGYFCRQGYTYPEIYHARLHAIDVWVIDGTHYAFPKRKEAGK